MNKYRENPPGLLMPLARAQQIIFINNLQAEAGFDIDSSFLKLFRCQRDPSVRTAVKDFQQVIENTRWKTSGA